MYILGGYQKTGTEWMKFILVNFFVGKQETWADYNTALPNLDAGPIPSSNFFKSHNPHLGIAAGGIAQVRHPFDVCMSSYRYIRDIDSLEVPPIEVYIDAFIHNRGEITFNELNGCDYVDHVMQWMSQPNAEIVKHEDLRGPYGPDKLRRALYGLGFKVYTEDVFHAMQDARMGRMLRLDVKGHIATQRRMWRDVWTEDQRFRGGIAFRPIMDRFGYEQ
jgi:hypothetical protein